MPEPIHRSSRLDELEKAVAEYRLLRDEFVELRDANALRLVEQWGTRRPFTQDLYSDSISDFPDLQEPEKTHHERALMSEIERRRTSIGQLAASINKSQESTSRHESTRLKEARNSFAAMLRNPHAREADFQKIFAKEPRLLSEALPLDLSPDQIEPLARAGRSEPDFVIYPDPNSLISSYGVIELKRPQSQILHMPRKHVLALTSDAQTAIRQCAYYGAEHFGKKVSAGELFFLGNSFFSFVIMGLSAGLRDKFTTEVLSKQLSELIPDRSCQIIPYDTLLEQFDRAGACRFMVLVHQIVNVEDELEAPEELGPELHQAAAVDDRATLASLFQHSTARKAVNYQNPDDGTTPLIWAALHGNLSAVQELLSLGARVNTVDKLGRTALFPAAANQKVDIARVLLEAGADLRALRYRGWTLMLPRAKSDPRFAPLLTLLRSYGYWE